MLTDEEKRIIANKFFDDYSDEEVFGFAEAIERAVLAKAMTKQDPIGKICKSAECGGVDFYFDKIPDGETMLYAWPQPAQASAITDDKAVSKFLSLAEDLIKSHPFLYVEIARTRTTDWMAMLRDRPHGNFIAQGQGLTAVDACTVALSASPKPE